MNEEVYYVQVFLGLGWADLHMWPKTYEEALRWADDYTGRTGGVTLRIERRDGLGEDSEIWRTPGDEPRAFALPPLDWQRVGF